MSKEDTLKICMAIKNIAMVVDDENLKKIKPFLDDIKFVLAKENIYE